MSANIFTSDMQDSIKEAFPNVSSGVVPLGGRVLVQLRRLKNETRSGIILIEETKDTAKYNNQIAKVIAVGPVAFRNRDTNTPWPEGAWVASGDYVRVPRWGGDRIEVKIKDSDEPVQFAIFNDYELIAKVTGDPLEQKIYII